jgi:hypothetical protein
MNRRTLLATTLALLAPPLAAQAAPRTQWRFRGSEGFDALCFLGPLSGKPFYARYYEAELAAFKPRLTPAAVEALASLQTEADQASELLGPNLCTLMSGGPDATLDELIATLDQAETAIQPTYQASPYWDAADWKSFLGRRDRLRIVLRGLADADFAGLRRAALADRLTTRLPAMAARFAAYDVIAEQERLLGRPLQPSIEVILLWFSKPHGIRIQGQRFLSHVDYPDSLLLRNAAHEILHPPFAMDGPAAKAALAVLGADPLLARIVAEHNPAFGYNSLEAVLNEDTVQALEQIVSERLSVAVAPAERWAKSDDGMHVLAAGLYGLLKADDYDRTGANLESWMRTAAADGKLAPARLHAAAAAVLRVPESGLWPRKT